MVCKCIDISRKYWKTEKTISSRKRRRQLFVSEIFKKRKSCEKWNRMGEGNFKNKVMDNVRRRIFSNLGLRFEGREWEETLLYAMASNSDLFGTAMERYNERQLLKRFLGVIKIPPLGQLDFELKLDIEFYARFLALYTAKMKRDWIKIDADFSGIGKRDYYRKCEVDRIIKIDAEYRKSLKKYEEHPEYFQPSFEEETREQMRKFERSKKKKRKKKQENK
jgi:hypothetical protein